VKHHFDDAEVVIRIPTTIHQKNKDVIPIYWDYFGPRIGYPGTGVFGNFVSVHGWAAGISLLITSLLGTALSIGSKKSRSVRPSVISDLQGHGQKKGTLRWRTDDHCGDSCPTLFFANLNNIYIILLLITHGFGLGSHLWFRGWLHQSISKKDKRIEGRIQIVGQIGDRNHRRIERSISMRMYVIGILPIVSIDEGVVETPFFRMSKWPKTTILLQKIMSWITEKRVSFLGEAMHQSCTFL